MKKIIFALIALSFLSLPTPAKAEEGTASRRAAPAIERDAEGKKQRPDRPKKTFEERKASAVARAQKRLACVQSAQTPEALRACSPRHGGGSKGGKGGKGRHHRGGGDQPAPTQ